MGAILACAVVLGCSGGAKRSGETTPAGAVDTCAPLEDASLVPAARPLASSSFTLGELFPHAQATTDAPVLRSNLDRVRYGSIQHGNGQGFGTGRTRRRFDASWLVGGIRPELASHLDAWVRAVETSDREQAHAELLARRLRILAALVELPQPPADLQAQLECVAIAHQGARAAFAVAQRAAADERTILRDGLANKSDLSANEHFLAAYIGTRVVAPEDGAEDVTDGLAATYFHAVADDAAAPTLLRVRALEAIAWAAWAPTLDAIAALEKIVELTDDPTFVLPARFDRALREGAAVRRKDALAALVAPFESATDPRVRADRGRLYASLAAAAWEADDAPAALDAWAKCLGASDLTEDDDDDPLGCASSLAAGLRSIAGVSGASASVRVSDTFAGSLGLAVMRHAIDALDRTEAERAGELALARGKDTEQAALVIALLGQLTADPARRRALLDRRNADYGATTAWYRRARLRLAASDVVGDHKMAALLEPQDPVIRAAPTTDDEWRVELRDDRAPKVADTCAETLQARDGTYLLHIDTMGPVPRVEVKVDVVHADAVACLERAVGIYFRSVPPAELTLVLQP